MANETFTVERTTLIAAPAATVFGFIDDFHQWALWSPWEKVAGDELVKSYAGPDQGVGSIYEWTGKKTGQGRMEIARSTPASRIDIDLQFIKPFKQRNETVFTLKPVSDGTEVSWTMTGRHNAFSKVMGLFMSMDKVVGKDFATGLENLKLICEADRA
jgi:hypothetical protein